MLIILEGPDGAGKTTLANRLHSYLSGLGTGGETRLLHRGPITDHPVREYELDLQSYRPHMTGGNGHVICDRWHLGELIYGPILRGESKLDPPSRWHIEAFLRAKGAIIVHVTAPHEELARRVTERGDDLVSPDQLRDISDEYYRVVHDTELPKVTFAELTPETLEQLLGYASGAEQRAARLPAFPGYIGDAQPRFLLVGEQRNDGPRGDLDVASAFAPLPGMSGLFLLRALSRDVLADASMANALEVDIGLLWQSLGHPITVALGKTADAVLKEHMVPHGAVPHPQYVRRFHHGRQAEYGALIRDAIVYQKEYLSWPRS